MFSIDATLKMFIWLMLAFSTGAIFGFMLCACAVVTSDTDPARRENKDQ